MCKHSVASGYRLHSVPLGFAHGKWWRGTVICLEQYVLPGSLSSLTFFNEYGPVLDADLPPTIPEEEVKRGRQQAITLSTSSPKRDLRAKIVFAKHFVH